MGSGGWKSPFPFRFGGGAHQPIEDIYYSIRSNVGDAFSQDEDSAIDVDVQSQSRLLGYVDSILQQFTGQSDPRVLTTMLARWEQILGLYPSRTDSHNQRTQRVASKLLTTYSATTEGVDRIARESFYPWATNVKYVNKSECVSYWPGGTSNSTYDWYSTIAHIVIEYYKPSYVHIADARKKEAICLHNLDTFAPSWVTYDVSMTPSDGINAGKFGFYLDVPNIDVACLDNKL